MAHQDGESTSQFVLGDDDRLDDRDIDASVRALRPRSSRRGSWESEVSRWSARIAGGPGTPSLTRERSLWTTNSNRGGGPLHADGNDQTKEDDNESVDGKAASTSHSQLDEVDPTELTPPSQVTDDAQEPAREAKEAKIESGENNLLQPEPRGQLHRPSVETIGNPETKNANSAPAPPVPSLKPSPSQEP